MLREVKSIEQRKLELDGGKFITTSLSIGDLGELDCLTMVEQGNYLPPPHPTEPYNPPASPTPWEIAKTVRCEDLIWFEWAGGGVGRTQTVSWGVGTGGFGTYSPSGVIWGQGPGGFPYCSLNREYCWELLDTAIAKEADITMSKSVSKGSETTRTEEFGIEIGCKAGPPWAQVSAKLSAKFGTSFTVSEATTITTEYSVKSKEGHVIQANLWQLKLRVRIVDQNKNDLKWNGFFQPWGWQRHAAQCPLNGAVTSLDVADATFLQTTEFPKKITGA
jgi:hypothetical protein